MESHTTIQIKVNSKKGFDTVILLLNSDKKTYCRYSHFIIFFIISFSKIIGLLSMYKKEIKKMSAT